MGAGAGGSPEPARFVPLGVGTSGGGVGNGAGAIMSTGFQAVPAARGPWSWRPHAGAAVPFTVYGGLGLICSSVFVIPHGRAGVAGSNRMDGDGRSVPGADSPAAAATAATNAITGRSGIRVFASILDERSKWRQRPGMGRDSVAAAAEIRVGRDDAVARRAMRRRDHGADGRGATAARRARPSSEGGVRGRPPGMPERCRTSPRRARSRSRRDRKRARRYAGASSPLLKRRSSPRGEPSSFDTVRLRRRLSSRPPPPVLASRPVWWEHGRAHGAPIPVAAMCRTRLSVSRTGPVPAAAAPTSH